MLYDISLKYFQDGGDGYSRWTADKLCPSHVVILPIFFLLLKSEHLLVIFGITRKRVSTDVLFAARCSSCLIPSLTRVQDGRHFGTQTIKEVSGGSWTTHIL